MLVAHISDLHQLSLEGVKARHFIGKRLTGGVNLLLNRGGNYPRDVALALMADVRDQQPDHVVLSGDLTNLAFSAEFELVRDLLEELSLPPRQVTVVPGNHDYYTRSSLRDETFCKIMGKFLHGDLQPGAGPFPMLRVRGELALVALCSAHPSAPFMAVGTLGSRQLRQTEKILGSEQCKDRFRLVVLHHSPAQDGVPWKNRLTDGAAFRAMIARAGAELMIHGHLHRFLRRELPGPGAPVPLIGVGSSTWLSPHDPERRAQYNLYEIQGRSFQCRTRRLDPGTNTFEPYSPTI